MVDSFSFRPQSFTAGQFVPHDDGAAEPVVRRISNQEFATMNALSASELEKLDTDTLSVLLERMRQEEDGARIEYERSKHTAAVRLLLELGQKVMTHRNAAANIRKILATRKPTT